MKEARARYAQMSDDDQSKLVNNITCGLPGAEEGYSLSSLREQLSLYSEIDADQLR